MIQLKNSFVFAATGQTQTAGLYDNGMVIAYTMVVPALAGTTVTSTLSIKDDDGVTIYTGDAKAESSTNVVTGLLIPCNKGYTATITLDKDAGTGGGTITVKLFLDDHR